jgi:uncharacterized membrane protein
MAAEILSFINIFFAGLLAGEEFVIRFGIRGPLARLDQRPHIELRKALILTLRVLVPALFAFTILTGVAVTILHWGGGATTLRCASLATLVAFISITLTGTVPINQAVLRWDSSDPPPDWREWIRRWERLDTARTYLALAAFALVLV